MRPPVTRVVHNVATTTALVAVTATGLTAFYRATELTGSSRDRALIFGAVLIVAAELWIWGTERRARWIDYREFETAQQHMRIRQRALEDALERVRANVDIGIAEKIFLQSMEQLDDDRNHPWRDAYKRTP